MRFCARFHPLPCQGGSGDGTRCSSYITPSHPPLSLPPPHPPRCSPSSPAPTTPPGSTTPPGPISPSGGTTCSPSPFSSSRIIRAGLSTNCPPSPNQVRPQTPSPSLRLTPHNPDTPSSPSESSLISEDGSPSPQHLNVVCNVPIVVPKPRPYRSLANLQFQFDLPSEDQDLSHPPYCTSRSAAKRKRTDDDDDADDGFASPYPSADRSSRKRRAFSDSSFPSLTPSVRQNLLPINPHGTQPVTRYAQSAISNQLRHRQPQGRPR